MKVGSHHVFCIVTAIAAMPFIASAWLSWAFFRFTEYRPWMIITSYGRIPDDEWNLAFNIGWVGALALCALLLYLFEGVTFRVASSGLHGTADWGTVREARKEKLLGEWGIVIGRLGGKVLRASTADHSVILLSAPPRSGKGVGVIIPTLLEYPGSFIVYDVKGENLEHTARRRGAMGDAVRVFCPFDLKVGTTEISGRSHGFNPLAPIAKLHNPEDRLTEISLLASALLTTSNPKEQGLLSSGTELFKAVCAIVCARNAPSLARVVDLLSPEAKVGEPADMKQHLAGLAEQAPDEISKQALLTVSANKNENIALYIAVLFDAGLKAWRDPKIRRATERHDFDFLSMRSKPQSVYLCVPTPYKEIVAPVVRLFFQSALRAIQMRLPDPDKDPLPVLFMIDEFHSLGYMREVIDAPTVIPGYGGRIVVVVQSPASLDAIYGRENARVFLDLAQLKIFMTPNDNQTKEMIEKTLGYRSKVSKSVSARRSGGDSASESYSEIRRPLMSADDIGKMPSTHEIITVQGASPFCAERIRYYEDEPFQTLHASQEDIEWHMEDIPSVMHEDPAQSKEPAKPEGDAPKPIDLEAIGFVCTALDAIFKRSPPLMDTALSSTLDALDRSA